MLIQRFLRQQWMRFAVSQVSWGRADQLRDFMAVLKLRAIDLDYGSRIVQQRLGGGLHDASFSGAGRAEKQKIPNRPPNRGHPGQVRLISLDDLMNGFVLSHDEVAELVLQILRLSSRLAGI